jgi:hypothetical protein
MGFRKSISIGLGTLTLFVGTPYAQENEEITIESNSTTTFFSAPFNFDGEGTANYAIFSGFSNLGKVTGQGVSQSAPTGASCTLPDGSTGIALALVDHVAVTRFENEGGALLYERGGKGDLRACLNLETGVFFEEGTVPIIGGTGRFSGATGSYDATQQGQILVPPGSEAGLQFGYATATYRYTITVPSK